MPFSTFWFCTRVLQPNLKVCQNLFVGRPSKEFKIDISKCLSSNDYMLRQNLTLSNDRWVRIIDTFCLKWQENLVELVNVRIMFFFGFFLGLRIMQVSISSITIPPGHDLKGAKTLPPGQSFCTKTLPSGQYRESKAPPPGHKVRKFHKCIYKLWHYLKRKVLWSQQIKRFFNEET